MKKISAILTTGFLFAVCSVFAGGFVVEVANVANTTNTVASDISTYNGYIEQILIDVTGTTTGTIAITSTDGDVIYTNSSVTADTTVRPRFLTQSSSGTDLEGGTNVYARYYMWSEGVSITLSEAAGVTNTYKIKFKLDN